MINPVSIFIAYSHNDLALKDELKKFLRPLLNTGQAQIWDDHNIEAGKDWEAEIKERLYGADVIMLLVSPDSLASEYFYGKEVMTSLERHARGEAVVIPVILRPCPWTITPLKQLEAIPEKGKAVTTWVSQDEAFTDVAQRLGDVVESMHTHKQGIEQQETARREFIAAVDAASHLEAHQNWPEALKSYRHALQLHEPGFLPDINTLKAKVANCENSLRGEEKAAMQAQKEATAAAVLEQKRQAEAEKALRRQSSTTASGGNDPNKVIYIIAGIIVLVLLLVFGMRACQNGQSKLNVDVPSAPTENPENEQLKTIGQAYFIVTQERTLPSINNFLQQYPNSPYQQEAQQLYRDLEAECNTLLHDADVYIQEEDWENARAKLNAAAKISPNDPEIERRWRDYSQSR